MTKRILMVLVASVVVAIAVAPVASANPASSQYDQPTITTPVTNPAPNTPVTNPAPNTPVSSPAPKVNGVTASVTTPKPASKPASTPTQVTKVSTSDTLPFTGLDLGLFLVIGGVAVASGLGLRRVAARRSPDR